MKTEIKFVGLNDEKEWPHFQWSVKINGCAFEYRTGLGHRTDQKKKGYDTGWNKKPTDSVLVSESECWAHIPKIDDVLHCLFMDANAGLMSFHDFCEDLGYSDDSLKALDTYRACMATTLKLQTALGKDYVSERQRIEALEL